MVLICATLITRMTMKCTNIVLRKWDNVNKRGAFIVACFYAHFYSETLQQALEASYRKKYISETAANFLWREGVWGRGNWLN